jgi:hypothetical protein
MTVGPPSLAESLKVLDSMGDSRVNLRYGGHLAHAQRAAKIKFVSNVYYIINGI